MSGLSGQIFNWRSKCGSVFDDQSVSGGRSGVTSTLPCDKDFSSLVGHWELFACLLLRGPPNHSSHLESPLHCKGKENFLVWIKFHWEKFHSYSANYRGQPLHRLKLLCYINYVLLTPGHTCMHRLGGRARVSEHLPFLLNNVLQTRDHLFWREGTKSEPCTAWLQRWDDFREVVAYDAETNVLRKLLNDWSITSREREREREEGRERDFIYYRETPFWKNQYYIHKRDRACLYSYDPIHQLNY